MEQFDNKKKPSNDHKHTTTYEQLIDNARVSLQKESTPPEEATHKKAAFKKLKAAIALQPNRYEAYLIAAEYLADQQQNYKLATDYFEQALTCTILPPEEKRIVRHKLITCYSLTGQHEKWEKNLKADIKKTLKYAELKLFKLGEYYLARKDKQLNWVLKMLRQHHKNSMVRCLLVALHKQKQGNDEASMTWTEAALDAARQSEVTQDPLLNQQEIQNLLKGLKIQAYHLHCQLFWAQKNYKKVVEASGKSMSLAGLPLPKNTAQNLLKQFQNNPDPGAISEEYLGAYQQKTGQSCDPTESASYHPETGKRVINILPGCSDNGYHYLNQIMNLLFSSYLELQQYKKAENWMPAFQERRKSSYSLLYSKHYLRGMIALKKARQEEENNTKQALYIEALKYFKKTEKEEFKHVIDTVEGCTSMAVIYLRMADCMQELVQTIEAAFAQLTLLQPSISSLMIDQIRNAPSREKFYEQALQYARRASSLSTKLRPSIEKQLEISQNALKSLNDNTQVRQQNHNENKNFWESQINQLKEELTKLPRHKHNPCTENNCFRLACGQTRGTVRICTPFIPSNDQRNFSNMARFFSKHNKSGIARQYINNQFQGMSLLNPDITREDLVSAGTISLKSKRWAEAKYYWLAALYQATPFTIPSKKNARTLLIYQSLTLACLRLEQFGESITFAKLFAQEYKKFTTENTQLSNTEKEPLEEAKNNVTEYRKKAEQMDTHTFPKHELASREDCLSKARTTKDLKKKKFCYFRALHKPTSKKGNEKTLEKMTIFYWLANTCFRLTEYHEAIIYYELFSKNYQKIKAQKALNDKKNKALDEQNKVVKKYLPTAYKRSQECPPPETAPMGIFEARVIKNEVAYLSNQLAHIRNLMINRKDEIATSNEQALRRAVTRPSVSFVNELCRIKEAGGEVNINAQDDNQKVGRTALHWAIIGAGLSKNPKPDDWIEQQKKQKFHEIILILLSHGANIDIPDRAKNWTAKEYAKEHGIQLPRVENKRNQAPVPRTNSMN